MQSRVTVLAGLLAAIALASCRGEDPTGLYEATEHRGSEEPGCDPLMDLELPDDSLVRECGSDRENLSCRLHRTHLGSDEGGVWRVDIWDTSFDNDNGICFVNHTTRETSLSGDTLRMESQVTSGSTTDLSGAECDAVQGEVAGVEMICTQKKILAGTRIADGT